MNSRDNFNNKKWPVAQHQKSLQPRAGGAQPPDHVKPPPIAPPIYRPQTPPRALQGKMAQPQPVNSSPQIMRKPPAAPPVYRPQPAPMVLQAKKSPVKTPAPYSPPSAAIPIASHPKAPRIGAGGATMVIQRAAPASAPRTRSKTLHEAQFSSDINPRLILGEESKRVGRSPAHFGVGDGTPYGVGAHAVYEGVSTTNVDRKFSGDEKDKVNKLGNMYGCQQCGTKASGWDDDHWTPDHQPPLSKWFKDYGSLHTYKGKLYPHCKKCSSHQGGILSGMGY